MITKFIYITNTRLPSEKANSYQSMQMCYSFSKVFDEVELWTGRARNTEEFNDIKNVDISSRVSSNKKFTSFSITAIMKSPSVIIKKYKLASKINGIISL